MKDGIFCPSWDEVKTEIFTPEEIAESESRVALIGEKIKCKKAKRKFANHYQYVKWKCAPKRYDKLAKYTPVVLLAADMYMPNKKKYGPRPYICINTNGLDVRSIKNENLYIRVYISEKYLKRVLVGLTVDSKSTSMLGHLWRFCCHMNSPKDVEVNIMIVSGSDNWYKNNIMIDVSENFHNRMLPYFNFNTDSFEAAKENPDYGNNDNKRFKYYPYSTRIASGHEMKEGRIHGNRECKD